MAEQVDEKGEGAVADDWAAAMSEQAETETGVVQAEMSKLTPEAGSGEAANLESILDIPVTLSVEIGKTKISIRNLLQLNQGSVVELDRLVGEALDVMVNGMLVAHGEVVVVNEKYGIRLTDVVSAHERVKKLQ